jgi:hypothetical protein
VRHPFLLSLERIEVVEAAPDRHRTGRVQPKDRFEICRKQIKRGSRDELLATRRGRRLTI